jgi:HK97 family phage major capsid protein
MLRAMSTTSGSAVVPRVWAGDIIDRALNLAAVLLAGAQIVPMDAKTVNIGRLTTDPTAAFRNEGSTVVASDTVFDNVTLTSKTLSALVVGSMEWFQDAPNVDQIGRLRPKQVGPRRARERPLVPWSRVSKGGG